MYIGHYGVALGIKRARTSLSLGLLFAAVTLSDLIYYVRLTHPKDRYGRVGLMTLSAILIASDAVIPFMPGSNNAKMLATSSFIGMFGLAILAGAVDKHRDLLLISRENVKALARNETSRFLRS
jgi:hypothetical protein